MFQLFQPIVDWFHPMWDQVPQFLGNHSPWHR
ncbi:hypothetical protein BJY24_002029 [Nocardia transvalensis]|uniref:Uncharacterized protein n=1 Tax=Nocardia transvalensis TaxID=37333 RepID=A0A7W9PBR1_9NOCA|nr:hypothetical protein [Nocardia transvalensis]